MDIKAQLEHKRMDSPELEGFAANANILLAGPINPDYAARKFAEDARRMPEDLSRIELHLLREDIMG